MSSDVIGTTASLTRTEVNVKVIHRVTVKKGVAHFNLVDADNIKLLARTRGEVEVVGQIEASFICPASADFVATSTAAIVPADPGAWPVDVEQVAEAPCSANFATSAISGTSRCTLIVDPTINSVLKPLPLAGRHPAVLVGWDVQTSSSSFSARFEFSFRLSVTGVDWVRPASWR